MTQQTTVQPQVWTLPRESREWVGPITVRVCRPDVDPVVVGDWQVTVLPAEQRPVEDDWGSPTEVDDGLGVLVGPGSDHVPPQDEPSTWWIWVRYTANPERPVIDRVGYLVFT